MGDKKFGYNEPGDGSKLFHSLLSDPEFMFNYLNRHRTNSDGSRWNIMKCQLDYQMGWLLNDKIVIASSRASGKTSTIESTLFRIAITNPNKESAYIVLNEKHMRRMVANLVEYCNRDDFTQSFYSGYIKKDKIIYFNNGHKIEIRIAGQDKTGAKSLVGLHADFIIIDEAQILSSSLLAELMPGLNAGGKLLVAGVPNDIRNSMLYHYCADNEVMYYRYSAHETETWTEEKEKDAVKLCRGKNTNDYKNLYLGQWSGAKDAVFDSNDLIECIHKDVKFNYCVFNGAKFEDILPVLNLPKVMQKYSSFVIGSDIGYTERSPMHISVLGIILNTETDEDGKKHKTYKYDLIYRCEISGMSAYDSSKVFDYMMTYFDCKYACLDAQNFGSAVHSNLTNREIFPDTFHRNIRFIIPLEFRNIIIMGRTTTIDQSTGEEIEVENKVTAKVASTIKLQELVFDRNLRFSFDDNGNDDFDDIISILQSEAQEPKNNTYDRFVYSNNVNQHCFVAGTKIITDNGYKTIENIKIGDKVLTREGYRVVLNSWKTQKNAKVKTYNINGFKITCTPNHNVLINGEWNDIDDLKIGDNIITANNQKDIEEVVVQNLEINPHKNEDVYDITVDSEHEFFANNILVHNCVDSLRCCAIVILQIIERGELLKSTTREIVRPSKIKSHIFGNKRKNRRLR